LPISIHRLKSVLVGASGRWILRLHHALRSSGGEVEDPGFGFVRVLQSGGSKQRRKMNRALRVIFIISYFFGVLFVRGDVLCSFLIYTSSLSQKKKNYAYASRSHAPLLRIVKPLRSCLNIE